MKILHIISQFPGKTGSGIYVNSLIDEGKKNNHEQGLVGAIQEGLTYENDSLSYLDLVEFNTEELPFNIVGMSDIMPYPSTRYKDLSDEMLSTWVKAFEKSFLKALNIFNPDIIISHHLWILTSLVCKYKGNKKVVAICHGTDIRQMHLNPKYTEFVLEGCQKLDYVLTLSTEQKSEINLLYNIPQDKIEVIGAGYNQEFFYPPKTKPDIKPIKLIYAGKLSNSKGIPYLIKAYSNLRHKYDIELKLAGDGNGEEKEKILEMANENGAIWLGNLSQKELGNVFRKSHIFVLPSFYEGLGLVTIEALACGLLVVATNHNGIKEYLGDKINNSGIIEYVDLPPMSSIDDVSEDGKIIFEKSLEKSIEKMIKRILDGYNQFTAIDYDLKELSWERLFIKLINILQKL
ncbi:MAG: glycosyltransferase family 4 protein [Tissierellales bacterium]|nr:glycosyltransferase family 4 protein [Tissierellales bacterium]